MRRTASDSNPAMNRHPLAKSLSGGSRYMKADASALDRDHVACDARPIADDELPNLLGAELYFFVVIRAA